MKENKARRFRHEAVNHVYQRTRNHFNIFYDLSDYLVYFTVFCTCARKYDIDVYSLCLMIDHIHCLVRASAKECLSNFISNVTSVFVKEYNHSIGRKGPLFEKRFGSAPKADRKKLVSAIIYLGNNPVEKRLCTRAEQYRWNFLAYMDSPAPFSEPLVKYKASPALRNAMKEVDRCSGRSRHLNYSQLRRMMSPLSATEKNQLTDHIITSYNIIDYDGLLQYFESYQQLLISVHSTTGTEYDIKETIDKSYDNVYREMIKTTREHTGTYVREVIMCDTDRKLEFAKLLRSRTKASIGQIAKFLHLHME